MPVTPLWSHWSPVTLPPHTWTTNTGSIFIHHNTNDLKVNILTLEKNILEMTNRISLRDNLVKAISREIKLKSIQVAVPVTPKLTLVTTQCNRC